MNRQESYRKKSWLNVLFTSSHLCFLLFFLLCVINGMPSHTAKQTEIHEWLKAVTVFVFASPSPLVIGKAWGGWSMDFHGGRATLGMCADQSCWARVYAQMRDTTVWPISLHANVYRKSEIVFQTNVLFFKIWSYKTALFAASWVFISESVWSGITSVRVRLLGEAESGSGRDREGCVTHAPTWLGHQVCLWQLLEVQEVTRRPAKQKDPSVFVYLFFKGSVWSNLIPYVQDGVPTDVYTS